MDWSALYPDATAARTKDQLAQPKSYAPADRGAFSEFWSGVGNYFMRGMAETARNASMAGAVVPMIADKLIGSDNTGESLTDRYFRFHDETFQNAVDYWTPKPGSVGFAGEVVGRLAAGLTKFVASPALMVADLQLTTATDLTRAGVDTGAALVAGDLAGLSAVVGVALPFVGSTLGVKMASGVAGNVLPNMAEAQATKMLLNAAGSPEQAAQFDPFDMRARAVDVLMGMAFGGAAHYMTKTGQRKLTFTEEQKDALLTVNQARHMERSANHTTDAEVSAHVQDMRTAVDQLLRGEAVNAPERAVPQRIEAEAAEIQGEVLRVAGEDAKPPIERKEAKSSQVEPLPDADPAATATRQVIADVPDLRIPTGEFNPDGTDVSVSAADFVAKAEAEAARAETDGHLYRTAAECLLGAL